MARNFATLFSGSTEVDKMTGSNAAWSSVTGKMEAFEATSLANLNP
jgi:hypothetical protein